MKIRDLKQSDVPILQAMAQESGYPYPELSDRVECIQIVADDNDIPVMAGMSQRAAQVYLLCGQSENPHSKLYALRLLHEQMAIKLRALGYTESDAYLPPQLERQFSRRLEKSFGWARNWNSWVKRF